jgi:hypothetical protein
MQSPLIFIAEFQAKSRFLNNFALSDDGISQEHNDDAQGREGRLSILTSSKSYSTYESGETTSQGVLPGTGRNQKRGE